MGIDHSDEVGWPAQATRTKKTKPRLARHVSNRARQQLAQCATSRVRRAKYEQR